MHPVHRFNFLVDSDNSFEHVTQRVRIIWICWREPESREPVLSIKLRPDVVEKGFKEIKILNNISTVKTSDVNKGNGASRYRYDGNSKTVYNVDIDDIHIETDGIDQIRKIKMILNTMEDNTFFSFTKQIKADFGNPCYSCCKGNSGNGSLVWKTEKLYMEYIWEYFSWGKWKPVIVIGILQDLPTDIRKMYEDPKDGF